MGQYYVFANVTKCQSMHSMMQKAIEIIWNGSFQFWLPLFLIDLGDHEYRHARSLQNLCLKFLCNNEQQYPPTLFEHLPKPLLKKMDTTFLSQQLVGEWAGDRLIITGDYSEYSPFPPHGEWKKSNLFNFVYESGKFSDSHAGKIYEYYHANKDNIANKLQKLCGDKVYKVVNLDKKEYLDPQKYGAGEKTVLDFGMENVRRANCYGVMAGLVISLIHSTGSGGGDLPSEVTSQGMWAGDRIIICTPEQLDDSYTDVSNASDVKLVTP